MAVGQGALLGGFSYVAIGREIALGTYNTCTAALDVLSASIVTTQDSKILPQIERARTLTKRLMLMKKIGGNLDFYYSPTLDSNNFILQNAFGGTITSATATGETTGAGANSAMNHTFNIGGMDQSYPSLCINIRKGDSAAAQIFNYSGVRVNEINFSANIDEALKCSVGLVGMDSTLVSNDVSSALAINANEVLSFVNGRVSLETSFNSLTSTAFWHVQSAEFGWSNSLKSDADSGRIGSRILTTLPPGMANYSLKLKLRFDTSTAFAAMIAGTKYSAELQFKGSTLTSSSIQQGVKFTFPTLYIKNSGDPTIGGPDQILMSEVEFDVLRDDTTTTGYALQAVVTNQKANYA